ncbi:MAG: L-threonylcarbamoyladenylate synthase [Candidatus Paceibacterota bacterium]|jgi:L-threonylcarbamoyladenylate synthase|nr:L-threonylcarbamoyladenylate synthase [bacterium]
MSKIVFGKKEINIVKTAYSLKRAVVLPTDTIYGITAPALDKKAVLNLYDLKGRNLEKPFIILISSLDDLLAFGVKLDNKKSDWLKKIWPQKITVTFPCNKKKFSYLHRGTGLLAFRIPDNKWLTQLIKIAGPIVAPSANTQGKVPAEIVREAYEYFGDSVTYLDGGKIKGKASTIVSLENNSFEIIRQGSYKLKKNEYFRSGSDN